MIAGFAGSIAIATPQPQNTVTHVYMLNIGQGDSFLIEAPNGKRMLIDGGKDSSVLTALATIVPSAHSTIDVVVATHPDADHIGGLQSVLKRYDVGLFLTTQVIADTKVFASLYGELYQQKIPAYYVRKGMSVSLDQNVSFTVLFPDRDTSGWKTNEASVVGMLHVGTRSILFTGDSPLSVEHALVGAYQDQLNTDIVKLGHHGSKTSTGVELLKATTPTLGLVSAGIGNSYHHPNVEVLDRLKALSIPWISTQDQGTVDLSTDGIDPWSWESVE